MTGARATVAERLAASDQAELVDGAIVSASVLVPVSAHSDEYDRFLGTILELKAGPAASLAVYFSVLLLICVGYLSARHLGRTGRAAVIDAAVAGLFGLIVAARRRRFTHTG